MYLKVRVESKKSQIPSGRLEISTARVTPSSCVAPGTTRLVSSGNLKKIGSVAPSLFDCKNESRPSAPSMCPAILVSECLAIITLASTSLIRAAMVEPLVVVVACTLVVALAVATGAAVLIVSTKQASKEPV